MQTATLPEKGFDPIVSRLPESIDSERLVLGVLLTGQVEFDEIAASLEADDFSLEKHKKLFATIKTLSDSGRPYDIKGTGMYLKESGRLDSVDGLTYLIDLSDTPAVVSTDFYIERIVETSQKRKLLGALEKAQLSIVSGRPIDEVIGGLDAFSSKRDVSKSAARNAEEVILDAGGLDSMFRPMRIDCSTGIPGLDRFTFGYRRKALYTLVGSPGGGKSSFCFYSLLDAAFAGNRVLIISLEMSKTELIFALSCSRAQVNAESVMNGESTDEELNRVKYAASEIASLGNLFEIIDDPMYTLSRVRAQVKSQAKHAPYRIVALDYLQLLSKREDQAKELAEYTRQAKILAKEQDLTFLLLSQMNRTSEKDGKPIKPTLSMIAASSGAGNDSDVVMFLFSQKQAYESEGFRETDLVVVKNRAGRTGRLSLVFVGQYRRFYPKEAVAS